MEHGHYGICQLYCGELATRMVAGFALGETCLARLQPIARDAGIPFQPDRLPMARRASRLVARKHKPLQLRADP